MGLMPPTLSSFTVRTVETALFSKIYLMVLCAIASGMHHVVYISISHDYVVCFFNYMYVVWLFKNVYNIHKVSIHMCAKSSTQPSGTQHSGGVTPIIVMMLDLINVQSHSFLFQLDSSINAPGTILDSSLQIVVT